MEALGLLVLVALVAAAVAIVVLLTRRKGPSAPTPPADPLRKTARGIDPRQISVGSVVNYDGRDFLVRGTLDLNQDGFTWQEHHLDDASVRRWLSVEDDEELEICLWEVVQAPELEPGAPQLDYGGTTYTLDEHGTAQYRASGSTGTAATGSVEYYDYSAGASRLAFERYGSASWEVSTGQVVNERELDIYPAAP